MSEVTTLSGVNRFRISAATGLVIGLATGAISDRWPVGLLVVVIATATLGPLVGVLTLGDAIINSNVYGPEGRLAGAILVAVLAVVAEVTFALLQRAVTPAGLRPTHGMSTPTSLTE